MRIDPSLVIVLSDGAELTATRILPDDGESFPCIVQAYPYRKDDLLADTMHRFASGMARYGYAGLLVDMRNNGGSRGASDGVLDSGRESEDMGQVVEWAATQPWCDGNVGFSGHSYGGWSSYMAAVSGAPHLKAAVVQMSCADGYGDFNYPGGCRNMLIAAMWEVLMFGIRLAPPGYQDTRGRWRSVWHERLADEPWTRNWHVHPTRDEAWRRRSVDPARVTVPTYLVAGWRDLYPIMPKQYSKLPKERKIIVGPWMHCGMDEAPPDLEPLDDPNMQARWFDRWLKQEKNGVEHEPPVTLFVQGAGWRHDTAWPVSGTKERLVHLSHDGSLADAAVAEERAMEYTCDPTVGTAAGIWDAFGSLDCLPRDQHPDDMRSLAFTGEPVQQDIDIIGSPEAELWVALDSGDDANLVVKLCAVAPDGTSKLITTGWLKASHRESHEQPLPLPEREFVKLDIPLWSTAYRVPAGHRLRVSVSLSDFPRIWPLTMNPTIRLAFGGARASIVRVPIAPAATADGPPLPPVPREVAEDHPMAIDGSSGHSVTHDYEHDTVTVTKHFAAITRTTSEGTIDVDVRTNAVVPKGRPDTARVEGTFRQRMVLADGTVFTVEASTTQSQTETTYQGRVEENGRVVFDRTWHY